MHQEAHSINMHIPMYAAMLHTQTGKISSWFEVEHLISQTNRSSTEYKIPINFHHFFENRVHKYNWLLFISLIYFSFDIFET